MAGAALGLAARSGVLKVLPSLARQGLPLVKQAAKTVLKHGKNVVTSALEGALESGIESANRELSGDAFYQKSNSHSSHDFRRLRARGDEKKRKKQKLKSKKKRLLVAKSNRRKSKRRRTF